MREEALRRGALRVLTRPFSEEDLEREVFRALEP
jgi:FixJ family two-component response regulator